MRLATEGVTAEECQAADVMKAAWLELGCLPVSASTQKKMPSSRQAEKESVKDRSCIVIRTLPSPELSYAGLMAFSCPCLTCSIKITQVGISEVVYSQSYGMDLEVSLARSKPIS